VVTSPRLIESTRKLIESSRKLIRNELESSRHQIEIQKWSCVGKLVLVPPPLSALTPSFQPRRWCCELLVLLSSSEIAAHCWTNWHWHVVAACLVVVVPARCRRCELFLMLPSSQGAVDCCTGISTASCIVFCTRCSGHYYIFCVSVAVTWNYGVFVTWLALVQVLFCLISRIRSDFESV